MTKERKSARPKGQGARVEDAQPISQTEPSGSRPKIVTPQHGERLWRNSKECTKVKLGWWDTMMADPRVPDGAFRIAYALASRHLSSTDGTAWPSRETLGRYIGAGERTAHSHISLLVRLGYLIKKRGGQGHPNVYRLRLPDRQNIAGQELVRPAKNIRSKIIDRNTSASQTGNNLPTNPCINLLPKGDAKASPHTSSVVQISNNSIAAARAADARMQPGETTTNPKETTAMNKAATAPTLDHDDEHEQHEGVADWKPECPSFEDTPGHGDNPPEGENDLPDAEAERRAALDAARERGARNRRKGMPRKAVPSELRADPDFTTAYWAGFDAADAELRSNQTSSSNEMSDADREAYRAGWQAHRDGLDKQAPASLGGWGSAWAAWMTGWTDAKKANGAG